MKRVILLAVVALSAASCERPADVASRNLSYAADNFQVTRRIVFFNGITDKYLMVIEGKCALGNADKPNQITITCRTGEQAYKKHFLGLSDNVSFFAEQLADMPVDTYHYKVAFRPSTIIPDVDFNRP